MKRLSRDPGARVKRLLRQEVNFGCPVRYSDGTGCGSPLLTYHHFDPPWKVMKSDPAASHNPDGIIALCPPHHTQADAGQWTNQQLKDFKRHPFVDDLLRVQWPWTPETLVVRAGQALVVNGGAPLRLDGRPVIAFRAASIDALGTRTIEFDSDIRDESGAKWLAIQQSWFDLRLEGTTDVKFTPSARQLDVHRDDQARLTLRLDRLTPEEFLESMRAAGMSGEMPANALSTVDRSGGIDSSGRVPVVTLRGRFVSKYADVKISESRFQLRPLLPGFEKDEVNIPFIVSDANHLSIRRPGGQEFVRIG